MSQPPSTYREFKNQYKQLMDAYEKLGNEAQKSGPLNERERALVKLAIAVGASLEGGVHSHTRRAMDAGVKPDEIRHVVTLAITTLGFPSMMKNFTWVQDILAGNSLELNPDDVD